MILCTAVPATAQTVQSGNTIVELSQAERCNPPVVANWTDDELLVNPGFETGTFDPWYHDGFWSVSTTTPHAGTYCAYDIGNHWLRQDVTPTAVSDIISATVWCKQPEAAIAAIDFFYTNGTYSEDLIWPTANWQQFDVTGFMTPGLIVDGFRVWGYSGGGPDPDETFYDDLSIMTAGGPPDINVVLDPIGSPIIIPPTGGIFAYTVALNNNGSSVATFDAWIMVQMPDMTWFGPVVGPVSLTMTGGTSISRNRTQIVPATAPSGDYLYEARVGSYPNDIWDFDNFPFTKAIDGDNGAYIGDWSTSGDLFEGETPEKFALMGNYPNPFNPATTIEFSLNHADFVELSVFDVSGRHVATLVDGYRDAGVHEVTFDAAGMASGLYVYRLTSGAQTALGKMILIK
jgi:hypothetical protein